MLVDGESYSGCSASIAWIYPEETTAAIEEVFDLLTERGAWVPSIWRLEVANVLQVGLRLGRYGATFRDGVLADLASLPLSLDRETDDRAWSGILRLADRHGLTTYDAAYLELAQRRSLPLATLDGELRAAAQKEGIELLGL